MVTVAVTSRSAPPEPARQWVSRDAPRGGVSLTRIAHAMLTLKAGCKSQQEGPCIHSTAPVEERQASLFLRHDVWIPSLKQLTSKSVGF